MLTLPPIALTASDYPRLEQTARVTAQKGNMEAMFLLAEINRAEIVPDDDAERRTSAIADARQVARIASSSASIEARSTKMRQSARDYVR